MTLLALLGACGAGGADSTPPPPAVTSTPDTATVAANGTPATGNVLSNDATTSGTLSVSAVALQNGGTGTPGQPLAGTLGTLTLNTDGSYRFDVSALTPVKSLAAGQSASETYTYTPSAGGVAGTPTTLIITVTGANDAPVAGASPANASVNEGSTISITLPANAFSDPDNGATLTLSARLANGTALPAWLTFDPATGTFTGSPGSSDSGTYSIRVTATDNSGATATQEFNIEVVNTVSGVVADGYVAGATVFIDTDGNGLPSSGEPTAVSDATGRFFLSSSATGPLRAINGTNADTGLANTMTLTAPAGSTVINPLTTLVQGLVERGTSLTAAEAAVKSAFGLASTINLQNYDILAQSPTDPTALAAQKAAASIATLLTQAEAAGGQTNGNAAEAAVLSKLLDQVAGATPLNLGDPNLVHQIVAAAGMFDAATALQTAAKVAATNATLSSATSFAAIADGQKSAADNSLAYAPSGLADNASISVGGTNAFGNVLQNDRDANGDAISVTQLNGQLLTFDPDPFGGAAPIYTGRFIIATGTYGTLYIQDNGEFSYSLNTSDPDTVALGGAQLANETFTYTIRDSTGRTATATLTIAINRAPFGASLDSDNIVGTQAADNISGLQGSDVIEGRGGADVIDGGPGEDAGYEDTASYASSPSRVEVFLSQRLLNTGGDAAGDQLISIENLVGSAFDDLLEGDAGRNRLSGGSGDDSLAGLAGADVIDGGAHSFMDFVSYEASDAGININLMFLTQAGGHAEGDILLNIEAVSGSLFNDVIRGTDDANALLGNAGDDILEGRGGDDELRGNLGADRLDGGTGTDIVVYLSSPVGVEVDLATGVGRLGHAEGDVLVSIENLIGSFHDDLLISAADANRLRGGGGFDTVSYVASTAGVTVNLATGSASGGYATGDVLEQISHLTGSAFADTLTGNTGANRLSGGLGADTLTGGQGADQFAFDDLTANVDRDVIKDFQTGIDKLVFDAANFDEGVAFSTSMPSDGRATFIYDGATGLLSYDSDGNGAGAAIEIALLEGAPALQASDIIVG